LSTSSFTSIVNLGNVFQALTENDYDQISSLISSELFEDSIQAIHTAVHHNGWFIKTEIHRSLSAWSSALQRENVSKWTSSLPTSSSSKNVGIVCAGNIPLVGLHDLLCVLITGHSAQLKLSSKDTLLMMMVIKILKELNPDFENRIQIQNGRLSDFQAVIATGSDNSARYFEYYFKDLPSIIRKNRTSVALLTGQETEDELNGLGSDIFSYFGLGCRNVTKLYVPKGYDLNKFFGGVFKFKEVINHNKYANNFDYHRAVWLMNQEPLLENGFLLVKESKELVSPVGSIFYEYFDSDSAFEKLVQERKNEIQCVVSSQHTPFGSAQSPGLDDYADGINTLEFLINL